MRRTPTQDPSTDLRVRGKYWDLGLKPCGTRVGDKERCKRRRTPTQDPSTDLRVWGSTGDLGVKPRGKRLGIRKGGEGAVRLPKILVLTCV